MAEGRVLRRLESEVTCPLCLEIFTKPKKLPCEHVYCSQCLRGLALRSITASITCPECRADTPVPPNFDVSQFVTPHQVNRLVEMYQQGLKLADSDTQEAEPQPKPQPASCRVHMSQPLALYCETCESLVCRDCVLLSCAKKNHQHGFIQDMVEKYKTDLSQRLKPVKKLQQQMLEALEAVSKRERETQARKKEKLYRIEATFDTLAKILTEERQYFIKEAKKSFEEQEKVNSSKKSEISTVLNQIQSITHSTETSLANPPTRLLEDVAEIKQSLKQVEKLARNVSPQPALLPEMGVELWDPVKFKQECHINNFTYKAEDSLKSHFQRSANMHDLHIPINEVSTHTFHIDSSSTVFQKITISAQLQFCFDGSLEPAVVKKVTPAQYSLSFTPHKRGRHELHITHNNTHILGSPISIFVSAEPRQLKPIARKKINNVAGIKCHKGLIYVSDEAKSDSFGLRIFESLSKPAVKSTELPGLCEVLITGEHIYGTDVTKHRIVKMDMDGAIIGSTGRQGTGRGEFQFPNGIRQSNDGKIYVCDSDNHRIQVLDENLRLIEIIRNDFDHPTDLDFDSVGNLYIVDSENGRIQVLTPKGQHIRDIGRPGKSSGELNYPVSSVIHKDLLYVTDCENNRISVFKTSGEFVATLGEGITRPECIAMDDNGYIYVTNNRKFITVF